MASAWSCFALFCICSLTLHVCTYTVSHFILAQQGFALWMLACRHFRQAAWVCKCAKDWMSTVYCVIVHKPMHTCAANQTVKRSWSDVLQYGAGVDHLRACLVAYLLTDMPSFSISVSSNPKGCQYLLYVSIMLLSFMSAACCTRQSMLHALFCSKSIKSAQACQPHTWLGRM